MPATATSPAAAPSRMPDGFFHRGRSVTRLEAFVDAAFAFALTLLIISIDAIPDSIDDLFAALLGVPAFLASFAVLALFWHGHATWSRRYGLDDGATVFLSLLLVFLVLVFVYPLKMLFASALHWMSAGLLPATVRIESIADLQALYWTYAAAFALLGGTMALLTRHAWRCREELGLDAEERVQTRAWLLSWQLDPVVAGLSALVAAAMPWYPAAWMFALPGMCYALLALQIPLLRWRMQVFRKEEGLA